MAADMFFVSDAVRSTFDFQSCLKSRHDLVSALMKYVQENSLIDSQNKMIYRTNEELQELMNGKKVTSAFSAIRDLHTHLTPFDMDDTASGDEEEDDDDDTVSYSESEEEEDEQWHRELSVQNDKGEQLHLRCIRKDGESFLSINGFEVYESEFESYYERVVGNAPRAVGHGSGMLMGLFVVFAGMAVFSLWLQFVNQGLLPRC